MLKSDSDIQLEKEREWISLAKEDIRYFEPLYDKYYDQIFRFIFRRTDDEALAADLCSQTFYKALSNLKKYRWMGRPLGAWLYQIAANEIRKHFRNRGQVFVIDIDRVEEVLDRDVNSEHLLTKLTSILRDLNDEDLRLIELKFFEGQTFQGIAQLLSISESAAKMRIYRLLTRMRKLLQP